jgi:excisionase family DNA binding protein
MNMTLEDTSQAFVSTTEAGNMLGLSTACVQKLTDSNELKAWKTKGGHRRIFVSSILAYRDSARIDGAAGALIRKKPSSVLVVQENKELLECLKRQALQWHLPLEIRFSDSIAMALVDLAMDCPELLLVDMGMIRGEQSKVLEALGSFNGRGKTIPMFLFFPQSPKAQAMPIPDKLPANIRPVPDQLTDGWLHGFLKAIDAVLGPQAR